MNKQPPQSRKATERAQALHEAYRHTFSSEAGQRVLNDLMHRFHIFGSTFAEDARAHAFREGERNVVIDIIDKLDISPEEFRERYGNVRRSSMLEWADAQD